MTQSGWQIQLIVWLLFGMVLFTFVLNHLLYKRLETRHPEKYQEMGRPKALVGARANTGMRACMFIIRREHRRLGDRALSALSDFMLAYMLVYLVLALLLLVS